MSVLSQFGEFLDNALPSEYNVLRVIDKNLASFKPWEIVIFTILTVKALQFTRCLVKKIITTNWKVTFFRLLRKLPMVQRQIESELGKTVDGLEKEMKDQIGGLAYHRQLPDNGWGKDKVLKEIAQYMDLGEFKAENGAFSGICHKPPDASRVETVTEAYALTAYANPLNPDAFPGIRKIEAEVVRMTLSLFHGNDDAIGTMTSGGTESLILACKAYRNFGRKEKGITKPNIVMSQSGHVGFDKAGHLLGMEVRHVPMHPDTMQPDMRKFEAAIDKNTVMVVGSAPQYPHGVMDPIEAIAKVAVRKNIPMHVDACLGGFLLAFMKDAGFEVQPFDFRVKGVTSMSADTHKFGYAPKGSSVIMYSDRKYIHHQYYVSSDWSGGIFVSPTMAGSRSGGILAATWAAMMNNGLDGYRKMTKDIVSTLQWMAKEIRTIPGLKVLGDPRFCIVSFTNSKPDTFHPFTLADRMKDKGYLISCLQYPTCIHFYVTPMHTQKGLKEKFIADLRECTEQLLKEPKKALEGRAAVYGMAQTLPDRGLVNEMCEMFIDTLYSTNN